VLEISRSTSAVTSALQRWHRYILFSCVSTRQSQTFTLHARIAAVTYRDPPIKSLLKWPGAQPAPFIPVVLQFVRSRLAGAGAATILMLVHSVPEVH
jgi:hypothetical protein